MTTLITNGVSLSVLVLLHTKIRNTFVAILVGPVLKPTNTIPLDFFATIEQKSYNLNKK